MTVYQKNRIVRIICRLPCSELPAILEGRSARHRKNAVCSEEKKTAKSSTWLLTLADLRPKLNLDVLNDYSRGGS